ncbi:MAG: sensor histidine kinase [Chitinophagaceae bacterium]|nr:MAG: sensor histidine kinase [Chitinophagaceae bacterium]
MMMKLTAFVILMLSFLAAGAQQVVQPKVDSLLRLLKQSPDDSMRLVTLEQLALETLKSDQARALAYADEGITLARKTKRKKAEIHLMVAKGNVLADKGDNKAALDIYTNALSEARRLGNDYTLAIVLNDIGGVYMRASDYVTAIRYFTESQEHSVLTGDNNLVGTNYQNLSTVFYNQQDYQKSLHYAEQSLKSFLLDGHPDKIARAYNSIGNTALAKGEIDTAKTNYERALEMYGKSGNLTGQAIVYSQYAILFDPDYARIIQYQKISQAIWDKVNPTHYNSIINLGNIGETYLNLIRADTLGKLTTAQKRALFDSARVSLDRCLEYSRATNDMDNLSYFSQLYSSMLEMSGDYKGALDKYRFATGITDSLYSQSNKNAIAGLESKREIDLRDKAIEINKIALAAERRQRIALIAGLVLLLAIVFLVIRQNRIRRRTNTVLVRLNDQLDEANKVKAKFFAILSHDLRSPISNLVSFLELQQDAPDLLDPAQAKRQQQQISGSAKNLLETMESMLLWSKGQMEQFRPTIRPVPVAALYTHIAKIFEGSQLVPIRFDDPGGLTVNTDENYLQTIMQNLTANAVKALAGRENAVIRWSVSSANGETILSVTDNGPGLQREQVTALFDDAVVANEKTGLGLHLVRDLARAIGCRIGVGSQLHSGTTFTLSI